jgi:hypothetical protein
MISALVLLLITVNLGAGAYPVNETAGNYRISFEAGDDISAIATFEAWGISVKELSDDDYRAIVDNFDAAKVLVVLAIADKENNSQDEGSVVGVLILNESIDTTYAETKIVKNLDDNYVRIYDRIIDGHKGIYSLRGDGPYDSDLGRFGYYWLDESEDGYASKLVFVIGKAESSMETLLKTAHVEKIQV